MSTIGHNSELSALFDRSQTASARQRALLIQAGQMLWPKGHRGKDGRKLDNPMPRFVAKFEVDPETLCWNWRGSMQRNGYGAFPFGGKRNLAHRWIYLALKRPIADGLVVDHLCHNKRCVNLFHLEAVSQSVNVKRSASRAVEIPQFLAPERMQ
jgi:hypothetical protein